MAKNWRRTQVKLDTKTDADLELVMEASGMKQSEAIREAIRRWAADVRSAQRTSPGTSAADVRSDVRYRTDVQERMYDRMYRTSDRTSNAGARASITTIVSPLTEGSAYNSSTPFGGSEGAPLRGETLTTPAHPNPSLADPPSATSPQSLTNSSLRDVPHSYPDAVGSTLASQESCHTDPFGEVPEIEARPLNVDPEEVAEAWAELVARDGRFKPYHGSCANLLNALCRELPDLDALEKALELLEKVETRYLDDWVMGSLVGVMRPSPALSEDGEQVSKLMALLEGYYVKLLPKPKADVAQAEGGDNSKYIVSANVVPFSTRRRAKSEGEEVWDAL